MDGGNVRVEVCTLQQRLDLEPVLLKNENNWLLPIIEGYFVTIAYWEGK